VLTATCSDSKAYIESSKNHKKVLLPVITSRKCQVPETASFEPSRVEICQGV